MSPGAIDTPGGMAAAAPGVSRRSAVPNRSAGAPADVIQARVNEFNELKKNYKNPLYNSALTFLEPFPVGLLITVTSAGILRKKRKDEMGAAA